MSTRVSERLRRYLLAGAVLMALVPMPAAASPVTSVWPLESTDVLAGFGDSYEIDGETKAHTGADICGEPDEDVRAAVAGVVSFVGRVPAAGGGLVLAVTVSTEDEKWTYSPLSSAQVERGEDVECGSVLAALAESGDPSSGSTHLHLSVRRGELYVDPVPLLACADGGSTAPDAGGAAAESPAEAAPDPPPAAPVTPKAKAAAARPAAASTKPQASAGQAAQPAASASAPVEGTPAASAPANPSTLDAAGPPLSLAAGFEAAPTPAHAEATSVDGTRGHYARLLGIGGEPVVGLRVPGVLECGLGCASALLLWAGLARPVARRGVVGVPAAIRVEERG